MLSIVQRIEKPTEQRVTREQLGGVIFGQQVPIYGQDADDRTVRTWENVSVKDLIPILGSKNLLRLMISPTGVFGFYDQSAPFSVRGARIFATTPDSQEVEVPYVSYEGEAQEIMDHWSERTGSGGHYIAPNEVY